MSTPTREWLEAAVKSALTQTKTRDEGADPHVALTLRPWNGEFLVTVGEDDEGIQVSADQLLEAMPHLLMLVLDLGEDE